ncbi:MAG: aminoglycoside phosphotransferase [Nocardioidaceae bacterium]|nr:aminoglycoside phosphotransferase [Nocardioidaceae bacterium]
MSSLLHEQLEAYFAGRRWFAGKGRGFRVTHVHALPWLADSEPWVRIEVVTVEYDDGATDAYQFPICYLPEADPNLAHAALGPFEHPDLGPVVAYDAVYVKPAADLLLEGFWRQQRLDGVTFTVVEGAELPATSTPGTVMTAEQSNTSIAYGEDAVLKLFRRVSAGFNPDIEIHEALTRHGGEHVAPLLGWIDGVWADADGSPHDGHLGMLQEFLRTATDGWDIALASVRDLLVEEDLHPDEVGGDFAGEAERLGEATAEVHADLARLFGTGTLTTDQRKRLVDAMRQRLDKALSIVPELEEHANGLRHHFDNLADLDEPIFVQRVHGDFHLGQTLRTVKGWKIIDFEGEPAKSLPERAALDSPLRDVAGMLRSFDYAAGATLQQFGGSEQLRYRSTEWSTRNRAAFLNGYSSGRGEDASEHQVLLRAYEADKAVYEAVYETRNRPGWLRIPLRALARLAPEE